MLLNEITCNLFYTSDQSAAGVKEAKVRTRWLFIQHVYLHGFSGTNVFQSVPVEVIVVSCELYTTINYLYKKTSCDLQDNHSLMKLTYIN